jgi:hypothetical protein
MDQKQCVNKKQQLLTMFKEKTTLINSLALSEEEIVENKGDCHQCQIISYLKLSILK